MIDYISGTLFIIGIMVFLARSVKASMIEINVNYPKSTEILNIFIYAYLLFMTVWLNIILIIRAIPLFNDKNIKR